MPVSNLVETRYLYFYRSQLTSNSIKINLGKSQNLGEVMNFILQASDVQLVTGLKPGGAGGAMPSKNSRLPPPPPNGLPLNNLLWLQPWLVKQLLNETLQSYSPVAQKNVWQLIDTIQFFRKFLLASVLVYIQPLWYFSFTPQHDQSGFFHDRFVSSFVLGLTCVYICVRMNMLTTFSSGFDSSTHISAR